MGIALFNIEGQTTMKELNSKEVEHVAGGMKWEGNRQSDNVEDRRGWTKDEDRINPGSGTPGGWDNPRYRN